MYNSIRLRIRSLVRERKYYLTLHAEEEADNDEISLFDLERILREGEIVSGQQDERTGEMKYLINGLTFGFPAEAVVKIASDQVVVITVYSLRAK